MNSTVAREGTAAHAGHAARSAVRFAVDAIRSITWRELAYFSLIFLAVIGLYLAWMVEEMLKGGDRTGVIVTNITLQVLVLPFIVASWAVADRSTGRLSRAWRLAIGVLAGSALAMICVPPMMEWLGFDFSQDRHIEAELNGMIPTWAYWFAAFLDLSFFTGIGVAALEVYRRRTQAQRALEVARTEQARLARELLESRLAAMQAQVEPHFLFDSLVDVLATYDSDADRGADVMDRLITYLRVALPRLRESGSTVQAEVDLLAAYLAVVAARHGGLPAARFTVEPGCTNTRFSPMLLLPLVQRAMRGVSHDGTVPRRVALVVHSAGSEMIAQLRIESPGLCADDAELARVRDRLAGLYDGRSRLVCDETQPGLSQFTLCVPR
ncbi:MAG TPA: histidine kinase [Burkholderiaceae bacterium]|nr:histidine kinase [Burkholderiaceae bacterium]